MAYSSWKQRLQKDASYESDPVFVDMLVNLRNTNKFWFILMLFNDAVLTAGDI